MLARSPGLSLVIVLTLTIGISVNTTLFSFVDWLWLRSSPFSDPDCIVRFFATSAHGRQRTFSYSDYLDLQSQMPSFDGLAAVEYRGATLRGEPWCKSLLVGSVSRNFFSVLGVQAERDDRDRQNLPGVVISHRLWKSQFNSDPNLVGRSIELTGSSRVVLGVAPPSFTGVRRSVPTDIWYSVETWDRPEKRQSPRDRSFMLLGRLGPNADIQSARAEARVAFERLELKDLSTLEDLKPLLLTEPECRAEEVRSSSLFLLSVALVILVIAFANISGLLLVRAEARSNEMGVRQALGCTRVRLIRQLLTEGWLLSSFSAGSSLLLVYWVVGLSRAFLPAALADPEAGIRLNPQVVGFTIVLAFVATSLFGLAPAFRGLSLNLLSALRAGALHASQTRRTFFGLNSLMAGQLALALVLTMMASLLLRSFLKLTAVDLGFIRKNILLAE
ncbi:MAG: ABC transporter permease [Sedimentisphaerales bacterium]